MLRYGIQAPVTHTSGATLTASYGNAATTFQLLTGGFVQTVLFLRHTPGASEVNSRPEIRIRASYDGINFFQLANEQVAAGLSTLTPRVFRMDGTEMSIPIDIMYKAIEISIRETGVTTNFGTIALSTLTSGG